MLSAIPNNARSPWFRDAGLRRLNFWMLICIASSYGAGYDSSLISGLQTVPRWYTDLGNPHGQMLGVIGMCGSLGFLVGPFWAQWLGDRYGRHYAMMSASLTVIVGAAITAVRADDPVRQRNLFIVGRSILGLGSGISYVAAPSLMTELAHPRQRAVVVSCFQVGFYLGSIVSAWLTFGTGTWNSSWSWRLGCIFQLVPFAVQLPILVFCPQSPRFLVAHGRDAEAQSVLARYHANGDESDPLVQYQMDEIRAAVRPPSGTKDVDSSWSAFVRTRANLHRLWIVVTLAFAAQFVGNGVISYYLAQILTRIGYTSSTQQAVFNGGLSIFNLGIAIVSAQLVERVGRRPLLIWSGSGMLASFCIITGCSARFEATRDAAAGTAAVAFLFLFFLFYTSALTPLLVSYLLGPTGLGTVPRGLARRRADRVSV